MTVFALQLPPGGSLPIPLPPTTLILASVDLAPDDIDSFTFIQAYYPNHDVIAYTATLRVAQVLVLPGGNVLALDAADWVRNMRARGIDPWVMCPDRGWEFVKSRCLRSGVAPPHWWAHTIRPGAIIPEAADAVHYATNSSYDGHIIRTIQGDPMLHADEKIGSDYA